MLGFNRQVLQYIYLSDKLVRLIWNISTGEVTATVPPPKYILFKNWAESFLTSTAPKYIEMLNNIIVYTMNDMLFLCYITNQGLSWSWLYGSWIYNYLCNQCLFSITTKVVNLNPIHGEVYSIQHYVIKFVSDLQQVGGFLQVLRFPPPIKLIATI